MPDVVPSRAQHNGVKHANMSTADFTQIRYAVDGAVAVVSLWRPEVVNGEQRAAVYQP